MRFDGPSGAMTLYDDWHETASGHTETTENATLTVVDGTLLLSVSLEGGTEEWEKDFTICGRQLAELIQAHGHRA